LDEAQLIDSQFIEFCKEVQSNNHTYYLLKLNHYY